MGGEWVGGGGGGWPFVPKCLHLSEENACVCLLTCDFRMLGMVECSFFRFLCLCGIGRCADILHNKWKGLGKGTEVDDFRCFLNYVSICR